MEMYFLFLIILFVFDLYFGRLNFIAHSQFPCFFSCIFPLFIYFCLIGAKAWFELKNWKTKFENVVYLDS